MARLFTKAELPHHHSTRDTRDRLDLLTDNVPVSASRLRADRIIYHSGDTAAKHYHTGCHHMFYILAGEGVMCVDDGRYRLTPGMVAVVKPNEVHWFENESDDNFSFVEFWAPPPTETVWIVEDDI